MKAIKRTFWGMLAGLTALWLTNPEALPNALDIFAVRHVLTDYTGIIAIASMSVAMILATRATWFEHWLNGLDKSFRLHKWLGITALVASISHWMIVSAPKWAIDLGMMETPDRHGPPPGAMEGSQGTIETLFGSLRDPAEGLGEKAFYIATILIILALIKNFPYKRFLQTHTILAVAYLVLVFHSVILFPFDLWLHPLGWITGLLMAGGTISGFLILSRRHGRTHRAKGKITKLLHRPSMNTLQTTIRLNEEWKGHKAGQFAFVTFDKKEGKHPFTMASSWDPKTRDITFLTKDLGDYTAMLPYSLHEGDEVTIEGPYGNFTFEDNKDRQIWVGAGIGITPFMARMKQLAQRSSDEVIDLFHITRSITPDLEAQLQAEAKAANINLHLIIDKKGTAFDADKLKQQIKEWKEASVWFCGPSTIGENLKTKLTKQGLSETAFHQELFDMR